MSTDCLYWLSESENMKAYKFKSASADPPVPASPALKSYDPRGQKEGADIGDPNQVILQTQIFNWISSICLEISFSNLFYQFPRFQFIIQSATC